MDAFWTWSGWTAVGSIACVLALATLIFATKELLAQRRQVPLFRLDWEIFATRTTGADSFHVVEFRNFGRGPGRLIDLTLCGAWARLDDEHRAPAIVESGGRFRLLVSSPDLGNAWVRYVFQTQANRQRFEVRWEPLHSVGAMEDEFDRQTTEWSNRSWWRRFRDSRTPASVAPGGRPVGIVQGLKATDQVKTLLHAPPGSIFYSGKALSKPATLKYVLPPTSGTAI
ncbi:hypothetical protein J7E68_06490 [Microbacterium sp. ISL-103]|uniref:hypothetical protein n=1 Tax=Microbacterium sp. ISL-103 TaxID=2819156 RepID=UPI001BECE7FD|nr:hypothetical protein [Microbacterium sp. ISL-103]MBT2474234.1 hypothetical protein [Microbacterium sp. ISL-103]